MEKEMKCPWCGEVIVPVIGYYQSQYGDVKEGRCPQCNKLISTRLAGIADNIIKKVS